MELNIFSNSESPWYMYHDDVFNYMYEYVLVWTDIMSLQVLSKELASLILEQNVFYYLMSGASPHLIRRNF